MIKISKVNQFSITNVIIIILEKLKSSYTLKHFFIALLINITMQLTEFRKGHKHGMPFHRTKISTNQLLIYIYIYIYTLSSYPHLDQSFLTACTFQVWYTNLRCLRCAGCCLHLSIYLRRQLLTLRCNNSIKFVTTFIFLQQIQTLSN